MQFPCALKGLDLSGHKPCFMSGQPVNDEKHGSSPVTHKSFQEFDKPRRIQPDGIDRIPKCPACCDRGNGTDGLTLAAGLDHRRLSLCPPCSLQRSIRTHAGFVQKEYIGAAAFGTLFQLWVIFILPFFNRLWVSFIRPAQRF